MLLPLVQIGACRNVAVYGDLVLDIAAERAIVAGYEVVLQQSDWAILSQLAAAGGAFVRGADLLAEIWGDDMRDDPMFLRSWVRRLNNRLANCCSGRLLIDTLPGSYLLITPAEWSREPHRVLN
jgi:DNA-binding response OmpR family regulator